MDVAICEGVRLLALIDLDGTLIDRNGGLARWVQTWWAENGVGVGDLAWLAETDRAVKERTAFVS